MSSRKWDKISEMYNTYNKKNINALAADNIEIAWPVIIKQLKGRGIDTILDFGCGAGEFCNYLYKNNYKIIGLDYSKELIKIAKDNSLKQIKYLSGNLASKTFLGDEKFDAIISIMAFHFIDDIGKYLKIFTELLNKNGIIIFAVFSPEFVKKCLNSGKLFENSKSGKKLSKIKMVPKNNVKIDVFVRDELFYKSLFEKNGFNLISCEYPPFTKNFIKKYNWSLPTGVSEFLIMSFKKADSK